MKSSYNAETKKQIGMTHNELVGGTIGIVKAFMPTVRLIKQRITYLINKDYMRRDDNDIKKYYYMP